MNKLKNYLIEKSLTVTDFSRISNLPVSTIWRYVNGKFKPCAINALRIEEATNGAVSRMELLYPEDSDLIPIISQSKPKAIPKIYTETTGK